MSDKIKLETFPSNKNEALTMLYLQNQDLSKLTPEEIYCKYEEAIQKIKQQARVKHQNSSSNNQ